MGIKLSPVFRILFFVGVLVLGASAPAQSRLPKKSAAAITSAPHLRIAEKLRERLPDPPFFIPKARAEEMAKSLNLTIEQLMVELVPVIKSYAKPPISRYLVGAVGRTKVTGDLILGVNLEFGGQALNQTVHGEQFVVARALSLGAKGLESLALSAAPCGHCRQWLFELANGNDLQILVPGQPVRKLSELLPAAFGPADLKVTSALLAHSPLNLPHGLVKEELAEGAVQALSQSYSPYSKSPSGVLLQLQDGKTVIGSYIENVAFNPSLSPLQSALVNLVAEGRDYREIKRAILVEKIGSRSGVSQKESTRALLASVAPSVTLEVIEIELGD